MLRELKTFTAECDAPVGADDCMEIITIQAPDEDNAVLVLRGQDWVAEARRSLFIAPNWYSLTCPVCAAHEDTETPYSGVLQAERNEEARHEYSNED
jgi:hypothetical protein